VVRVHNLPARAHAQDAGTEALRNLQTMGESQNRTVRTGLKAAKKAVLAFTCEDKTNYPLKDFADVLLRTPVNLPAATEPRLLCDHLAT
jgi:hypothetical protein